MLVFKNPFLSEGIFFVYYFIFLGLNTRINLHEGNTNAYAIHASLASLICAPFAIIFPGFGTPFLILALSIFATTKGFEIDLEARRYRKYGNYYSLTFGGWQAIDNPEHAELVLSTERSSGRSGISIAPRLAIETRTYDIVLHSNIGKETIAYEFLSYKQAEEALAVFESLGIPVHNRIQEKIAEREAR